DGSRRVDLPDSIVAGVGDEKVPRRIDGDVKGITELRLCRRAAVAREALAPELGGGPSGARPIDLPDAVVPDIGDEEVPRRVDGDARGGVERRLCRRAPVAREVHGPVPSDGRDDPRRGDLPDAVVEEVGDEEVPRRVDGDAPGEAELRLYRRAPVAREALGP